MINLDVDVMCQWCGSVHTIKEWNDNTYKKCINREMKRQYTELFKEKAFLNKTQAYYLCPNCGMWLKGSQLKIVNTDDPELEKLGGEPIMIERNNNNN